MSSTGWHRTYVRNNDTGPPSTREQNSNGNASAQSHSHCRNAHDTGQATLRGCRCCSTLLQLDQRHVIVAVNHHGRGSAINNRPNATPRQHSDTLPSRRTTQCCRAEEINHTYVFESLSMVPHAQSERPLPRESVQMGLWFRLVPWSSHHHKLITPSSHHHILNYREPSFRATALQLCVTVAPHAPHGIPVPTPVLSLIPTAVLCRGVGPTDELTTEEIKCVIYGFNQLIIL